MRWVVGLLAIVASLGMTPLAVAQTPADASAAVADPAGAGPYPVGVTSRNFQRTGVTGQRNLLTYIWYPSAGPGPQEPTLEATVDAAPSPAGGPFPVLTWSHGYTGTPQGYHYLLAHLASWGFVVVAPLHRGTSRPGPDCPGGCTDRDGSPRDWGTDRPDDLSYVLSQALGLSAGGDRQLGGMLDPSRVGGAGHSFGGWTTLALMSGKHPYKAAVAMAPGAPGVLGPMLPGLAASASEPAMIEVGSLDSGAGLHYTQVVYNSLPTASQHWLLSLQRAGHTTFNNRCAPGSIIGLTCEEGLPDEVAHTLIERWSTAFLLQWVAGDPRYGAFLDAQRAAGDPNLQIQVAGR